MPHRYFTTDISGGTAVLSGADAHHLAQVMHGLCLRGARLWPRYGRAGNPFQLCQRIGAGRAGYAICGLPKAG